MEDGLIDITNREKINSLLLRLAPGASPLWGSLDAQGMIEHLVEAVEYTNGKKIAELKFTLQHANDAKRRLVYSDFVIPRGARGYLADATQHRRFSNLQTAVDQLNKEIDAFEYFFKDNKSTAIHPEFGPMNHREWIIWHGKHFTHHFRQFGLLPAT